MGFKEGFEKVALRKQAGILGSAAKGATSVAGKGLGLGLKGAGRVLGGGTGLMGAVTVAGTGANAISKYRDYTNMAAANQRF